MWLYQPTRSEFLLKLSFSKDLKQDEISSIILSYKEDYMKKLKDYGKMEAYMKQNQSAFDKDQRFFIHAPLRYGIISAKSVVSWCDEMLNEIDLLK
nr:hypothetical protein [Lacrimispora algidixylanolytica]